MYCAGCGNQVDDADSFCGHCGRPLSGGAPPIIVDKGKDPGIAFILGIFIPGLGIIYSGKIREGFSYLVATLFFAVVAFAMFLRMGTDTSTAENLLSLFVIVLMAMAALHLFAAYAGYGYAKEYNESIRKPWSSN